MQSATECDRFLQTLWSLKQRPHGSVYFYHWGGKQDKTKLSPWQYVADGNWNLILPYGIVNALIHDAHSTNRREGKATKYFIHIPVWYEGRWDYWDEMAHSAEGSSEGNTAKRKAKDSTNCLSVVPYSASKEYRKNWNRVGRSIIDFALTMDRLVSTAWDKEEWWKEELSELVDQFFPL